MNNVPKIDEIISESNDSIPEEIRQLFENQFEDIPQFSDNEIFLPQNDLVGKLLNKMSTGESLNNMTNNIIEINEREKYSEDCFPFSKHTIELEENQESNKNIFKTKKLNKRGRIKIKNTKRKIHSKMGRDNVLTKIQVHFLTYLINVSNDIIEPYFQAKKNDKQFKQINYADKKNIKIEHRSKLKNSSIKDILQMKISSIYRNYEEDYNEKIYNFISDEVNKDSKLSWINNFFNLNYLKFFENHYYINKNENYFFIEGKKINFSKETKSFYNLLEENKNNPEMIKRLTDVSKRYFIRSKRPSHKIFLIVKNKN